MPTVSFKGIGESPSFSDVIDYIVGLDRDLSYYLMNLDTQNINRLDANVIIANTITADKMNVTELSAISANLGEVTAGTITGLLIRTAGSGERIQLSGNTLATYNSSGNLNGLAWGTGVSGATFGDVYFYYNGTPLMIIYNGVTEAQIMPTDSVTRLVIGKSNKNTHISGGLYMDNGPFSLYQYSGTITTTEPTGYSEGDIIWGTSAQGTAPHYFKGGAWYAITAVAV